MTEVDLQELRKESKASVKGEPIAETVLRDRR